MPKRLYFQSDNYMYMAYKEFKGGEKTASREHAKANQKKWKSLKNDVHQKIQAIIAMGHFVFSKTSIYPKKTELEE